MAWSFTTDRPVYLQVSERIREAIISGKFPVGDQIPSVRQLATDAAVNPNTVQRAFFELENEGLIVSRGTLGRFVTEDAQAIEGARKKQAKELTYAYIKKAEQLALDEKSIIDMIKEAFNERS